MRIATSILALLSCTTVALAADLTPTNVRNLDQIEVQKALENVPGNANPTEINVGGDTIGSAVVIGALPYSDSGNTCAFVHNYDAVCPYNNPGAPDVVYAYTPMVPTSVNIDLCTSTYDTKVYVYQNAVGVPVACNDDVCGNDGWKSALEGVLMSPPNTYYIVVDGYSPTDCGTYYLNVSENVPCVVDCPPGAVAEGEPDCFDNSVDNYNGGCNSVPPVWTPLPCSPTGGDVVVCGTYGGFLYQGSSYRDTDWYEINLTEASTITWCVRGEYDTLVGIIDGNAGCPASSFLTYNYGADCTDICVTANLGPGTWWLFAATLDFGPAAGACGGNYNGTLSGYNCPPVPVDPTSWGDIKNMYK